MHSMLKTPLLLMCTVGAFLLTGCESDGNPSGIDVARRELSLANVWPDADGNSWQFRTRMSLVQSDEIPHFATPDELPEMPSLDEIEALLPLDSESPTDLSETPNYRLQFDGEVETEGGALGKLLEQEAAPLPAAELAKEVELIFSALVVRGGIWSRTGEYIAFLDPLGTEPSYRILDSDLSVGHEWSDVLFPGGDEYGPVFHARILPPPGSKLPWDSPEQTIRLLYAMDTGALTDRIPYESEFAYIRGVVYGFVDFQKHLGPIRFREARIAWLDKGADGDTTIGDPQTVFEGLLEVAEGED